MALLVNLTILSVAMALLVDLPVARAWLGDDSEDLSMEIHAGQPRGYFPSPGGAYANGRFKRATDGPQGTWSCLPMSCQMSGCYSGKCGYWCRACGLAKRTTRGGGSK